MRTFSFRWTIEAVVLAVALVPLLLALFFRRLTLGPISVSNLGLFYVWLMLTVLAVLILMLRQGIADLKALAAGKHMVLFACSVAVYAFALAISVWIEIWLTRLLLRAR